MRPREYWTCQVGGWGLYAVATFAQMWLVVSHTRAVLEPIVVAVLGMSPADRTTYEQSATADKRTSLATYDSTLDPRTFTGTWTWTRRPISPQPAARSSPTDPISARRMRCACA